MSTCNHSGKQNTIGKDTTTIVTKGRQEVECTVCGFTTVRDFQKVK